VKTAGGTYAMVWRSHSTATTSVGHWGPLRLRKGYYLYVGSAFGPGGVRARVLRHCRREKLSHWHIDYLRRFLHPLGAWYSHDPPRLEHRWAQFFLAIPGMFPIERFGCSDCSCHTHLFHTRSAPSLAVFSELAGREIESWPYDYSG